MNRTVGRQQLILLTSSHQVPGTLSEIGLAGPIPEREPTDLFTHHISPVPKPQVALYSVLSGSTLRTFALTTRTFA